MPLPEPDLSHFLAAEGWLEPGNIQECYKELGEISLMYRTHRDALELRAKMHSRAEKWDHVQPIAETLAKLIKDSPFGLYMWCHSLRMQKNYKEAVALLTLGTGKFLSGWHFSYDLACCLAMTEQKEEARLKLKEAITSAQDEDIRQMVLNELEPLWLDISEM